MDSEKGKDDRAVTDESVDGVGRERDEGAEDDKFEGLSLEESNALSLASVLLIRTGLHSPRQAYEMQMRRERSAVVQPQKKRRRLRSVNSITREIEVTTLAIAEGSIDAKQGRAVLSGLRTLLAAKKGEGKKKKASPKAEVPGKEL